MPRLTFASYGVRITVEAQDRTILDRVRDHLPYNTVPAPHQGADRHYSLLLPPDEGSRTAGSEVVVRRDGTEVLRIDDQEEALHSLGSFLQVDVAELAPDRVFIHAGVVGWQGRAIVLPGRSFSGKTTLVMALVQAGATYYSDEYAVFDRNGRVFPFARPLWVRDEGAPRGRERSVESLGGAAGSDPRDVGLVVLSTYEAGARWGPVQLSPAEGLLGMLENAVSARRQPEVVIDTLRHVVGRAPVLKSRRGDAGETAGAIIAHCSKGV